MNSRTRLITGILATVFFIALLIPAYRFYRNNTISEQNRLIEKGKKEFFAREYLSAYKTYSRLLDSLEYYSDAAAVNYAHAAFMSSSILKKGFYGRANGQAPALSDSTLQLLANESQDTYTILTTGSDKKIVSVAYNQLGYISIKGNKDFDSGDNTDSLLVGALQNFRLALKHNPNNDSARFNYELIKKVLGFPETILSQTKALVAERRYIEAANLLETNMEKDIRLLKQKEFLQRIKSVAGIDTTYRGKRL